MHDHPEDVSRGVVRMILICLDIFSFTCFINISELVKSPKLLSIENHGHNRALKGNHLTKPEQFVTQWLCCGVHAHEYRKVWSYPLEDDGVAEK